MLYLSAPPDKNYLDSSGKSWLMYLAEAEKEDRDPHLVLSSTYAPSAAWMQHRPDDICDSCSAAVRKIDRFGMARAVALMPMLLHVSVFLFFTGVVVFFIPINKTVAHFSAESYCSLLRTTF